MTTYRIMNPFTGIPVFLIFVLETFKCFYKQLFNFIALVFRFVWFQYISHLFCGYSRNMNTFHRCSSVSNICIRNIQVYLSINIEFLSWSCLYPSMFQTYSQLFIKKWTHYMSVPMFLICIRNIKYLYKY